VIVLHTCVTCTSEVSFLWYWFLCDIITV
jgi:hypothetical protein